jgi:transposase-like protein
MANIASIAAERESITSIAGKIRCTASSLRRWCRDEASRLTAPAALGNDKVRLKQLGPEVKELRRANEILRKASASSAMPELDLRER